MNSSETPSGRNYFEGGENRIQRSMHQNVRREMGSILYSLNLISAYKAMSRTRCKPWDDRELDSLEGMKVISFIFTTISQTAFSLLFT